MTVTLEGDYYDAESKIRTVWKHEGLFLSPGSLSLGSIKSLYFTEIRAISTVREGNVRQDGRC